MGKTSPLAPMSATTRPPSRKRSRKWLHVVVVAAMAVTLVSGALPISAAEQAKQITLAMDGGRPLSIVSTFTATCDECVPDDLADLFYSGGGAFAFGAQVTTSVERIDWTNDATVDITYDDDLLRQGQTLPLADRLSVATGTVTATGGINGSYGVFRDTSGGTNFVPTGTVKTLDRDVTWTFGCQLPLPGESPRTCASAPQTLDIDNYTIFAVPFVADLDIVFKVTVSLTASVSSDGVVVARELRVIGGGAPGNESLNWAGSSPSTITDPVFLSCTEPAGASIVYGMASPQADPTTQLAAITGLSASAVVSPTILPDFEVFSLGSFGNSTSPATDASFGLAGTGGETTLGTLGKNLLPPVVDPGGDYTGNQGSPVIFDGTGSSSPCGFPTLRWDFSDGGVAFGPSPQHTFQGSGVYSGQLTATDATGLTSTATFGVEIGNVAPSANAGPDTTAAWGRLVAFNGAGTDPGADDQPTLTYSWTFGDGSPSATGGPSTLHSYSTPGSYVATLTVCDRHAACNSDARTVTIRKREVSLGSLGETAATYATASSRHASLVDEFGVVVNGRTVAFTVNGAAAGSGVTASNGIASVAWTPLNAAGTYSASAAFAGDTLYAVAEATGSVQIARKASSVVYTGATTGGPNKTVTLSAVLMDATGLPLSGRTVVFALGTQTVSAVTNSSGVASVQLKLAQKNGTYPLTATWSPAGADADRYTGAGSSTTFKLQAR